MMRRLVVVGAAALLLGACGGSPSSTSNTESVTVNLSHQPTGAASLALDTTTHKLTVHLKFSGLQPNKPHPSHIHTGSCEQQGAVIIGLGTVLADAKGNFETDVVIDTSSADVMAKAGDISTIPSGKWYVNLHTGPGLDTPDQFRPILCGDINTGAGVNATAAMKPLPGVGNNVTGTAKLTLDKSTHTLTVVETVTGLDPNSSHATHIHMGSCEQQGSGILIPLTQLNADATGAASATTTKNNVNSIDYGNWYVNVHNQLDVSTQVGYSVLACGDVVKGL